MIKLMQTLWEILMMDPEGALFVLGIAVGAGLVKICDGIYDLIYGRGKK